MFTRIVCEIVAILHLENYVLDPKCLGSYEHVHDRRDQINLNKIVASQRENNINDANHPMVSLHLLFLSKLSPRM